MSTFRSLAKPDPLVLRRVLFQCLLALTFVTTLATIYHLSAPDGLTWRYGGADGGELALAVGKLGVAHPPGYALYVLLGNLVSRFAPGDSLAVRLQWLSHLAAAGAVGTIWLVTARLARARIRERAWLAGLSAAIWVAFSRAFWQQALIVEVYALMCLLVALVLFAAIQPDRFLGSARLFAVGILYGLACGHHLSLLVGGVSLLLLTNAGGRAAWIALAMGFFVGLGASAGLVWLLAGHAPAANWGGVDQSVRHWWQHVTASAYHHHLRQHAPGELRTSLAAWVQLSRDHFSWPGLLLVSYGMVAMGRHHRRLTTGLVLWGVLAVTFAVLYGARDTLDTYTLPATMIFAIFAGYGLLALVERFPAGWRRSVGVFFVVLIASFSITRPLAGLLQTDHSDLGAFIAAAATDLPAGAVVVTETDRETFTLWYYHYIEGWRRDWRLIDRRLLQFDWYQSNLRQQYGELPPDLHADSFAWVYDPLWNEVPIATTSFIPPLDGRISERAGPWYVLR